MMVGGSCADLMLQFRLEERQWDEALLEDEAEIVNSFLLHMKET
jgi:hypothetical protein